MARKKKCYNEGRRERETERKRMCGMMNRKGRGHGAGALRVQKKFFAKIVSRGKVNNEWMAKATGRCKGDVSQQRNYYIAKVMLQADGNRPWRRQ